MENISSIQEDYEHNKQGIFQNESQQDHTEDSERTVDQRKSALKQVHNLFFPTEWREALVSPQTILLMSGQIESTQ